MREAKFSSMKARSCVFIPKGWQTAAGSEHPRLALRKAPHPGGVPESWRAFHLFFDPAGVGRFLGDTIRGVSPLRASTPGYLLASFQDAEAGRTEDLLLLVKVQCGRRSCAINLPRLQIISIN